MTILMRILLLCLLVLSVRFLQGQPNAVAQRISAPPQIDGLPEDVCWNNCEAIGDFRTYDPIHNVSPTFPSLVRIAYDDQALYILAKMTDTLPNGILQQLGERDQDNLNADEFTIAFDTYLTKSDAYYFKVNASGVQSDWRDSDPLFDAVWHSAVHIAGDAWFVEIRIPYAALRFPTAEIQNWGMQIVRNLRRIREISQWALEEKETNNKMLFWGHLKGLKNIDPPLRLSFTPYASFAYEKDPGTKSSTSQSATAFNGGLDFKLGLSEAYTLDLTLLPDFSQVRSDNEVKNLSAFETTYDENRPFFREGTELFNRADLLYSRRIGSRPINYSSVYSALEEGEEIVENPDLSRLINAAKVSGRNKQGLALGVFNALTDRTTARIRTASGEIREIETDPLTNYNILIADQQFKGASSIYLINTNVSRTGHGRDANVTGTGIELTDKKNIFEVDASAVISNVWDPKDSLKKAKSGQRFEAEIAKASGKFQFALSYVYVSDHYDINDLGVVHYTNRQSKGIDIVYKIFKPFGIFRDLKNSIGAERTTNLRSEKNENTYLYYAGVASFTNYLTSWWSTYYSPFDRYDYYEPRETNRYYIRPGYLNGRIGFSSDYRKKLALDGQIYIAKEFGTYREQDYEIGPVFRINRRLSGTYVFNYNQISGARAYVTQENSGDIIFGRRKLITYTNTLNTKYMFNPRLSATFWLRHYWRTGEYTTFYLLQEDGGLKEREYDGSQNFSFNSFNIDLSLNWEFAPGSLFTIVWKNAIIDEREEWEQGFVNNLSSTLGQNHWNTISLKFIYYLDYQTLRSSLKARQYYD